MVVLCDVTAVNGEKVPITAAATVPGRIVHCGGIYISAHYALPVGNVTFILVTFSEHIHFGHCPVRKGS